MIELQDHLATVVASVWSTIFGSDAVAGEPTAPAPTDLVAGIRITGEAPCVVTITCAPATARIIAAGMLDLPDESMSDDDVRDALGEFANMAAGNLKALLPPGHHLSLPQVAVARDAAQWTSPARLCDRYALQCGEEVVVATVHAA